MNQYKNKIINELKNYKVEEKKIKEWLNEYELEKVAKLCSDIIDHPDWQYLGGYILIMSIKKEIEKEEYIERIKYMKKEELMGEKVADIIIENEKEIKKIINEENDKKYKYGSVKSLMHGYLIKCNKKNKIIETPQELYIRISVQLYMENIKNNGKFNVEKCYKGLSELKIIHATPTLCNGGTKTPQMASCFLLSLDDSLESIYDNLKRIAMISKNKGGIGLGISKIRHGKIGKTGNSKGIIPMIKVFDDTINYVDQTGTRKGACTVFITPHHYDIEDFLELKDNFGKEEFRARNLTYCIWIPDLFMKKIISNEEWTLFNSNDVKGLDDLYGLEYEKLYKKYENDPTILKKKISARKLYMKMCEKQAKFGYPYIMFDDACNIKNNQNYLGHISNSNLCLEIIQYNKPDELISSCNLGSVVLKNFVKYDSNNNKYYFDYKDLRYHTKLLVNNINKVIDYNYYPTDCIKEGNFNYRPIGIGIIGLADTFALLDIPYESKEAIELTEKISAAMYHAGLQESCDLVNIYGKPFKDFEKSPIAKGQLQFDLWNIEKQKFNSYKSNDIVPSKYFNNIHRFTKGFDLIQPSDFNASESWDSLISRIKSKGIVNSVMFCGLPSASTAGIVNCNESHEPFHNNLYCCEKISGNYYVHNDYLVYDLEHLNLWNSNFINFIINNDGSIQNISSFYTDYCTNNNILFNSNIHSRLSFLELKYKTCFEIKQKHIIDLVSRRGHYVCQSQSINLYIPNPDPKILFNIHIYSWLSGQKTGLYYLRQNGVSYRNYQQSTNNSLISNNDNDINNDNSNNSTNKLVCYKIDGCAVCE